MFYKLSNYDADICAIWIQTDPVLFCPLREICVNIFAFKGKEVQSDNRRDAWKLSSVTAARVI